MKRLLYCLLAEIPWYKYIRSNSYSLFHHRDRLYVIPIFSITNIYIQMNIIYILQIFYVKYFSYFVLYSVLYISLLLYICVFYLLWISLQIRPRNISHYVSVTRFCNRDSWCKQQRNQRECHISGVFTPTSWWYPWQVMQLHCYRRRIIYGLGKGLNVICSIFWLCNEIGCPERTIIF